MKAVILNRGEVPWVGIHSQQRVLTLLNQPFLDWQVDALRSVGVRDICVLIGANALVEHRLPGVVYYQESLLNGTAGALSNVRHWLGDESFLVCHGTTFLDPQGLTTLLQTQKNDPRWSATVAVVEHDRRVSISEGLEIDSDGSLKALHRWHGSRDRRAGHQGCGLYLFHPRVLSHIPEQGYYDLKEQLLPTLLAADYRIDTEVAAGCVPVLSPEGYLRLQFGLLHRCSIAASGKTPQKPDSSTVCEDARLIGYVQTGENCHIDNRAIIIGPVILGDGCHIGPGTTVIGPAVVGNECRIGAHSVLQNCVLQHNVQIGDGSRIEFSTVGGGQRLSPQIHLHQADTIGGMTNGVAARPLHGGFNFVRLRPVASRIKQYRNVAYCLLKNGFDFLVASLLLIVTLPIWLLVMLAIYIDAPGPIFFAQRRCSLGGREFNMYKFRTMVVNADAIQDTLRAKNEVDGPVFKLTKDPRITRVGAFLRKTSLDELPQLINVLKGDMSIVGPRPLAIKEMRLNPYWRDLRLTVKPGITGLWQVEARSQALFHHWIHLDIEYVKRRSFFLDIKILLKTALTAARGS